MKKKSMKKLALGKKTVSVLKNNEQRRIKGGVGKDDCPTLTVCPDGCPTTIPTANA